MLATISGVDSSSRTLYQRLKENYFQEKVVVLLSRPPQTVKLGIFGAALKHGIRNPESGNGIQNP